MKFVQAQIGLAVLHSEVRDVLLYHKSIIILAIVHAMMNLHKKYDLGIL
jgi:hypothetical protein